MTSRTKKIITLVVCVVILALLSLLIFRVFYSSNLSQSSASGTASSDRKLIFSDEFNQNNVDTSKWNFCYDNYSAQYQGCTNYGNWENEWYTKSQVSEKQGNLVLTATREKTTGDNKYKVQQDYAYRSGMVSTGAKDLNSAPKWEGSYGYYEARILVPEGNGVWPAFWLLPTDRNWPPEIDAMEVLGKNTTQVLNTYHWKDTNGNAQQDSSTYTSNTKLSDNWHTYGVDWQKGSIDWYLDGKLIKSVKSQNVPSKKMQIIFNLAMGGTLPGPIDQSTPNNNVMLVDYVRVYDKK